MKTSSLVFIGLGIAFISFTAFATQKKEEVKRIVDKLQFRLVGLRNLAISFKHIAFDLDIKAVNPTNEHLNINTGFVKANVLRVYEKESKKLLAFTNLNTHKIIIPSGGFYQLPPAHIKIPLLTGGQMLADHLMMQKQEDIHKSFTSRLLFELDIEAVGQTHTITF